MGEITVSAFGPDLKSLGLPELLMLCCRDTGDAPVWVEFLRRFTPKIKTFIRATLRQSLPQALFHFEDASLLGGTQPSDLFQNTLIKLVDNRCAALRRFSGQAEEEFFAYLAVVTRSVVRDYLRRQRALKRPALHEEALPDPSGAGEIADLESASKASAADRNILAQEVAELGLRIIRNGPGIFSARDRLIFELHFFHDLSYSQIAHCQGIELSKGGVEKVVNRLKEHIRGAVS